MTELGAARIETVRVGEIDLAYETFGDPADPAILLVMGLATQMLGWPDALCTGLAERGHSVIRFDNRDIGLSTHLSDEPPGDLGALMLGDTSSASYRLSDMAADAVGLLDALGIESAHVVGASMGGMIAQTMAIEHPSRVRTLVSIMSTTGDPAVGAPTQAAMGALLSPPPSSRDGAMDGTVAVYRVIGSPAYPFDEAEVRERAGVAFDRGFDPAGVSRQLAAIIASGDRTPKLRGLRVPTLVVHGAADVLVGPSGGEATAAAIPGAEHVVIEGMGHDLPAPLVPELVDRIARHARRG